MQLARTCSIKGTGITTYYGRSIVLLSFRNPSREFMGLDMARAICILLHFIWLPKYSYAAVGLTHLSTRN